jgi:hypothetical protein
MQLALPRKNGRHNANVRQIHSVAHVAAPGKILQCPRAWQLEPLLQNPIGLWETDERASTRSCVKIE